MPEIEEFVRLAMEQTEEFYSEAAETAERNRRHPDFAEYARKSTADYLRDLAVAERLYDRYCDAYDAFLEEPENRRRAAALEKAHASLWLATSALDRGNAMFTAYLDEGVASKAAALFGLIAGLIKGQQKGIDDLAEEIKDIETLLKKARKEVTAAQVQKGLNLAVTAVTLCFPPLRGAKAAAAALAVAGGKLVADEFLGPKGPDNAAAAKTAVTDYLGLADEFGKIGNTLTTILSTVDTYVSDDKEVGKAKKTVESVRKKLASAQKAHAGLVRRMADSDRDLAAMAIGLEKAVRAASSARDRHAEHEIRRLDLLDLLDRQED